MPAPPSTSAWTAYWHLFIPKLVIALSDGYSADALRRDALAGLTVAILALPLSMAIAIGAGVPPEKGLITSVVAGFLISALGGSRFQVGGPAAAFVVVIAHVVQRHGIGGLLTATFLAGLILIAAGLMRLGTYIKYVPGPVILGFTTGIGVLIAVGQLRDLLGLAANLPVDFVPRIEALYSGLPGMNASAVAVGVASLATIALLKRLRPHWPGLLIAVLAASGAVWALNLPVETVGSRFGQLPSSLPWPALPDLSWAKVNEVLPSAFTIAFLVGVESLLSAVMADTIAGTRHRSNAEIVAQGVANAASPLFGGLPATGVIARTGTNITAGAKTPVSGVLHAVFVLGFMMLLAPQASYMALPCLAAVLLFVSWRLIAVDEVWHFLTRAPWDDRIILIATVSLTILVDLNVAISVGVVLASMLFMHRMAETPGIDLGARAVIVDDVDDMTRQPSSISAKDIPDGVRVFQLRGPLFFGGSASISEALRSLEHWPRVVILRMREVPLVDATAVSALDELAATCRKHGTRIIISGLQPQPRTALHRFGFLRGNKVVLASNVFMALEKAGPLLAMENAAGRTPRP